jgi:hypothetical protein
MRGQEWSKTINAKKKITDLGVQLECSRELMAKTN